MRQAWNQASATYQKNQQIASDSVYYGPWSPPESELQLLGDLRGRKVLEIGCGGGQSAIALARQGAIVTGIDISDAQLKFARQLAQNEGVSVRFIQSDAQQLASITDTPHATDNPRLASAQWQMILSINTFQYLADIEAVLRSCHQLLSNRGRLVISLDHPMRSCFIDEEENELALYPVRDYFDTTPLSWQFSDSGNWMVSYHHTVGEWLAALCGAGFRLLQLVEPPLVAEIADELWPVDGAQAALRNLPHTLILIAEKE